MLGKGLLTFLGDYEHSPVKDFWSLDGRGIPHVAGVYVLLGRPRVWFRYPKGHSPVFYIGMAMDLRRRLRQHLKWAEEARSNRQFQLYWPRYEYAAAFGGRYVYIKTWQGLKPKALEDLVMARFARRYRSFPVANAAGAWNRIANL